MSLPGASCQDFETNGLRIRFEIATEASKTACTSQFGPGHVKSTGATAQLVK